MMHADIAGRVSFGGIRGVQSMQLTRSRGIQPGSCQIKIPDLSVGVPLNQEVLFLSDGSNNFAFRDFKVTDSDFMTEEGQDFVITIQDFRWHWQFGGLFGSYNTIRAGAIIPETKKTIRELAELCLAEMVHGGTDVSAMPNDVFPEVNWNNVLPAVALQELCDQVGCVICPTATNKVVICRLGEGRDLPQMQGSQIDFSFDLAVIPSDVECHASPTQIEMALEVGEAVGMDTDGQIKPIDQLSYTPSDGWLFEDAQELLNVLPEHRPLATRWVFRAYRVKPPTYIPGFDGEVTLDSILPLSDTLVTKKTVLGVPKRMQAFVYGKYFDRQESDGNNVRSVSHNYEANPKLLYKGSVNFDNDLGLLIFSDSVVKYLSRDEAPEIDGRRLSQDFPELFYRCSFNISEPNTRAQWRHVIKLRTGVTDQTQPYKIVKDDVRREYVIESPDDPNILNDNLEEVKEQLRYYLDAESKKFQSTQPSKGTYSGFPAFELDGAIAQITHSIDDSGWSTTTVSRNTEHAINVRSLAEQTRNAKLNQLLKEADALRNASRKEEKGKR